MLLGSLNYGRENMQKPIACKQVDFEQNVSVWKDLVSISPHFLFKAYFHSTIYIFTFDIFYYKFTHLDTNKEKSLLL